MQKLAYQVKCAFSFSDDLLATFKDKLGLIKVKLRDNQYIDLSFQDDDVQSRINLNSPKRPHLKYIQTMLCAPLLLPDFKSTLVIGFGGGTIAKYYTDFYKDSQKVIVDIRPKLFDVAQEFFGYSPDYNTAFSPGDAAVFLKKASSRKDLYDIINVDIFIEGPVDIQLHEYFWSDLSSILSPKGVSVTNVWRGGDFDEKYETILKHHKKMFKTVFEIVNSDTSQVAMFGSQLPLEVLFHSNLDIKVAEMSGLTAVNFKTHINNLRIL